MKMRQAATLPRDAWLAGTVGTIAVHGLLVVGLLLGASRRSGFQPLVYSVELVAAPAPTSRSAPPAAVPAPSPPLAAPTVAPKPKPATRKEAPIPKPKTPPKVDPKAEPSTAKPVAAPLAPGATPGTGADADNVRVQGIPFPFPEYLRNLTNQILRRWARPLGAAALEAEVSFTIDRAGRVSQIKVVRSSRNYTFDLGAQGAVEQAAEEQAFGPLPAGWQADNLQVAFLFTPRNR